LLREWDSCEYAFAGYLVGIELVRVSKVGDIGPYTITMFSGVLKMV